MATNEQLFLVPEDLYRLGNSTSSLMAAVKPREIDIYQQNGVEMVIANGGGISLYNSSGLENAPLSGWVWEVNKGFQIPMGLSLIDDGDQEKPGHYTLAPAHNMSKARYISLLDEVALSARKVFKKDKLG